jgi:internalin A
MRYFLLILTLALFLLPTVAQDENSLTPYEIALQRIEEARLNSWDELDLAGLGLTELPPEIGELNYLQFLWLEHNELSNLPFEIAGLIHLQGLYLSWNQFSTFPSELINLPNLSVLGLSDNQLSSLPAEIGMLSNLEILGLDNNQLNSLPPEIGNLSNLLVLKIGDNHLNSLPAEIGKLSKLCHLYIANNQIKYLPPEIGDLRHLPEGNGCQELHLWGISWTNNPLISPPPEVLEEGQEAILAYLRNEAWWHLQRLIAGGAGAIGIVAAMVLGLRWRNRRGYEKKKITPIPNPSPKH